MTEQTPVGQPHLGPSAGDTVKVGLGRSNISTAVLVLAFLIVFVAVCVRGGLTTADTASRALSFGLGGAFAIPLVLMLVGMPKLVQPRFVIVGPDGLGIQRGKEVVTLAWSQLRAVGIGYAVAEAEPEKIAHSLDELKDKAAEFLTDKVTEVLQVSGKRRLVLEIFPVRPAAVDLVPRLKPFWKVLPPPAAGLPESAWRFPLPPVVSIASQVADAVQVREPYRWLGWFPRPWTAPR